MNDREEIGEHKWYVHQPIKRFTHFFKFCSCNIHLFTQQGFMKHLTTTTAWVLGGKMRKRMHKKKKKGKEGRVILQFSIDFSV